MIILKKSFQSVFVFFISVSVIICAPAKSSAEELGQIKVLKDLYINTTLAYKGEARAIIVAPRRGEYEPIVTLIQDGIEQATGVRIPAYADSEIITEEVLRKYNVIAVGNMATNSFIERLYRQWYVLLDLQYPGNGGYVVRSLHNPYGSGRNVIFVGGSDDKGVEKAARDFVDILVPGEILQVGRLMRIQLGLNVSPPSIGDGVLEGVVRSWRDSWRETKSGRTTGYKPSTFFGWNPISIAGIMYYMTGQAEYLEHFKALAMPNPTNIPLANRTSDAFNDPLKPLVNNDHYRSHLVDCVYDLIEESPLFKDGERLAVTNMLLAHQYSYDPDHTYSKANGSRHQLWHMMNIYTGSRYFSRYYPDPVWDKRLENVRKGFHSFIDNPTWGERDTLHWVSTSLEPVFDFFVMDGADEFVSSGTARTMMQGLEILMTGREIDDYNRKVPISLLHKSAYMLRDTRYVWMVRQLGFDFAVFRIGQSFWPSEEAAVVPPEDLKNQILVYPLAKKYWEKAMAPIPLDEGFQILSYHSGLSQNDDYFLVDGFCGLGRNPYHISSVYHLRMFNGCNILKGYANDVDIWFNGMSDSDVVTSAALKESFVSDGIAYLKTEVPSMNSSKVQRHLFYARDEAFIAADKIVPLAKGVFDVVGTWESEGRKEKQMDASGGVALKNGVRLYCADPALVAFDGDAVKQRFSGELEKGESLCYFSLFVKDRIPASVTKIHSLASVITGAETAFVSAGNYLSDKIAVTADFTYVDNKKLFLAGAERLVIGDAVIFESDRPVSFIWRYRDKSFEASASQPCSIRLPSTAKNVSLALERGVHTVSNASLRPSVVQLIADVLGGLRKNVGKQEKGSPAKVDNSIKWEPQWQHDLKGQVMNMTYSSVVQPGILWVSQDTRNSASDILGVTENGDVTRRIHCEGEVLSLWAAQNREQADSFYVLAGFKDDTLRAFSADGKESWRAKAAVHPSFRIGDRYEAPWFTDPGPRYRRTGIYAILVDDLWTRGQAEIAIGRPSTVEFLSLKGDLIDRVPTRWGNNTSLAVLSKKGDASEANLLLVGKVATGFPTVSGINSRYKNVSDRLYSAIPTGYTPMNAWSQNDLSHLQVEDLEGDGSTEVIFNLSGHWNELRVYDAHTGDVRWAQYFGPDERGGRFMRGMEVLDLDEDGMKEVVVGMKNGWICAFSNRGTPLWQHRFDSSINCLDGAEGPGRLVVGLADGTIALLDSGGKVTHAGQLRSSVQSLLVEDKFVFAADEEGVLAKFNLN